MTQLGINGLEPGFKYNVRVRGLFSGTPGEWSPTEEIDVFSNTTSGTGDKAPSPPGTFVVVPTIDSFVLIWQAPITNADTSVLKDMKDYVIEVRSLASGGTGNAAAVYYMTEYQQPGQLLTNDRARQWEFTYKLNIQTFGTPESFPYFTVYARDATNNLSTAATGHVQNVAPTAPTATFVGVPGVGSIALSWGPSASPDTIGYVLKTSLTNGFDPTTVGTEIFRGNSLSAVHTTATGSNYYRVGALDVFGQITWLGTQVGPYTPISPGTSDTLAPKQVTNLIHGSEGLIANESTLTAFWTITWDAVTQNTDNSSITDLDHYIVSYSTGSSGPWNSTDVLAGTTTAVFFGLQPGVLYYATVQAVDKSGNLGTVSATLSRTMPVPSSPHIYSENVATLAGFDVGDNSLISTNRNYALETADGAEKVRLGGAASFWTVTNVELTSNVATLTSTGGASLVVGDYIHVHRLGTPFDGTYQVSARTGTTVSYVRTNANISSTASTGGAIVKAAPDVINMSAAQGIWAGGILPDDSPFSVSQTGSLKAVGAGNIAGWTITDDSLESPGGAIKLVSNDADEGTRIEVGGLPLSGVAIGAQTPTYPVDGQLWIDLSDNGAWGEVIYANEKGTASVASTLESTSVSNNYKIASFTFTAINQSVRLAGKIFSWNDGTTAPSSLGAEVNNFELIARQNATPASNAPAANYTVNSYGSLSAGGNIPELKVVTNNGSMEIWVTNIAQYSRAGLTLTAFENHVPTYFWYKDAVVASPSGTILTPRRGSLDVEESKTSSNGATPRFYIDDNLPVGVTTATMLQLFVDVAATDVTISASEYYSPAKACWTTSDANFSILSGGFTTSSIDTTSAATSGMITLPYSGIYRAGAMARLAPNATPAGTNDSVRFVPSLNDTNITTPSGVDPSGKIVTSTAPGGISLGTIRTVVNANVSRHIDFEETFKAVAGDKIRFWLLNGTPGNQVVTMGVNTSYKITLWYLGGQ